MKHIIILLSILSICLTTSAQTTYPVITPQNAMQLVEIHQFRRSNVDEMRRTNYISHSDGVFSADGDAVFIAHHADIWRYPLDNLADETLFLQTQYVIIHMIINPNGEQIATYHSDNTLRTWDIATGNMLWEALIDSERIYAIAYHPDGAMLIVGDSEGNLLGWDTQSGRRKFYANASLDTLVASPSARWGMVGGWRME